MRTANRVSEGIVQFVVDIGCASRRPNAMAAGVHHQQREQRPAQLNRGWAEKVGRGSHNRHHTNFYPRPVCKI